LIEQLLTGFGSATAAGLNAYIPMLMLGLLARFTDVITLPHGWSWLENGWVLAIVVPLLMLVVAAVLAWAAVKLLRRGRRRNGQELTRDWLRVLSFQSPAMIWRVWLTASPRGRHLPDCLPVFESGDDVFDACSDRAMSPVAVVADVCPALSGRGAVMAGMPR
jgi:hypothetical protein